MPLTEFKVVPEQSNSDFVLIHAYDDRQLVLTFVSRSAIEDRFELEELSSVDLSKQRNDLLVASNLAAFESIIVEKYARADHQPYERNGMTFPAIQIVYDDIRHLPVSATVLGTRFGVADAAGRF